MVELEIHGNDKFEIDNYEMNQLGWEIATYKTLKHFREKYPDDEVYFIM